MFRGCVKTLQMPKGSCVYSSRLLHLQNLTHCGEVFGSGCIPALLGSESCRMTGMFPAGGARAPAGMFGIQHVAPRMLAGDALLLSQGMKIQAWRRLLFGMGVFRIE